jgi:Cytochrome c554 and c-prime
MRSQQRARVCLTLIGATALVGAGLYWLGHLARDSAAVAALAVPQPLAEPPKDQTFMGIKQCSACHFNQFLVWRQTKHAKGFEILPAKYKTDASCLKCHSTGHGEPTGYKDFASTPELAGTACEACHGPGSKHGEIAKGFGNRKLTKEEETYVRSTIYKVRPNNACIGCHLAQTHQKHPPYDKPKQ